MTTKFGEIDIGNIDPGLQVLRKGNFDSKIVKAFSIDGNRFNQSKRLATFDSIHDFKTFGTNPTDTIEYQRKDGSYNINKCFFNFNRIMCRGEGAISVENSFLTKPKGQSASQGAYDNKPYPITTIANVEDYFCLLNLYSAASEGGASEEDCDLRIIKGTPKTKESGNDIDTHNNITNTNFKNITQFIVDRGWCDIVGDKAYINTITDVSPAFRKYYIQNETHNNVTGITGLTGTVTYRAIISQETANDPAGSLGQSILTSAFGGSNILVEKPGQSRTYISTKIDSFFEPTLSGISGLSTSPSLNFNTTLTLVDKSTFSPLGNISVVIPYSKSGDANPNERTVINKDINREFPGISKKVDVAAATSLNGRDDPAHNQAIAFYSNPEVDSFSKQQSQKQIARHFTRKRLGDVLQASLCRLINSNYSDEDERIKFNSLDSSSINSLDVSGSDIVPKSAIFIGEDRMIIAYCLMNQIPCIYDNKNYTILYMPKRPGESERPQYSEFTTIPAGNMVIEETPANSESDPMATEETPVNASAVTPANSESDPMETEESDNTSAVTPDNSAAVDMETETSDNASAVTPDNSDTSMEISGGGMNFNNQTGGVMTRTEYRKLYMETLWNEPYYFYKYLFFVKNRKLTEQLKSINNKLINNTYQGNVFNFSNKISSTPEEWEELPMYYVCPTVSIPEDDSYPPEPTLPSIDPPQETTPSEEMSVGGVKRGRDEYDEDEGDEDDDDATEEVSQKRTRGSESPIIVAQRIVDIQIEIGTGQTENQYTFINVFNENTFVTPKYEDDKQILLSVTKELASRGTKYREVYFKGGTTFSISYNAFTSYFIRYFIIRGRDSYMGGKVYNPNAQGLDDYHMQIEAEAEPQQDPESENTDLYNKNVKTLQYYFDALNKYELYSIMDEASEANFYDINSSGVRVAYDCLFYVFFNNLVNDFKEQSNKVSYELLVYYLFQNNKDLYYEFDEIISFGSEEKINLDETILQSLTPDEPSIQYFKNILEVSINKRDEINYNMYTMFVSNNFIGQYSYAIENKFTHYGFTTIQQDFEAIIQNNIPTSTPTSTSTFTPTSTSTQSPYIDNSIGSKNTNTLFSQINTPPTLAANAGGEKTRKYKKPLKYKKLTYKKNKRVTHNKTKKNKRNKGNKVKKSKKVKK